MRHGSALWCGQSPSLLLPWMAPAAVCVPVPPQFPGNLEPKATGQ